MGFVSGTNTSANVENTATGIVTEVTGSSLKIAKTSGDFVAGGKLVAGDKDPSRTTWTYSCWLKPSDTTGESQFLRVDTGSFANDTDFYYLDNKFTFFSQSDTTLFLRTGEVFVDPAVWNHVVLSVDTTKSFTEDRVRLYLNGTELSFTESTVYPPVGYLTDISAMKTHYIGSNASVNNAYLDGRMTDINFVDGIQEFPEAFASNERGIWTPKRYHGRYGRSGWHLMSGDTAPDSDTGTLYSTGTTELLYPNTLMKSGQDDPAYMFNGNLVGGMYSVGLTNGTAEQDAYFKYTFPEPIENVTKIRIIAGVGDASGEGTFPSDYDTHIAINDGTPVTYDIAAGNPGVVISSLPRIWVDYSTLLNGESVTLTSITIGRKHAADNWGTSIFAIEVNGEVLLDHSEVGVDYGDNNLDWNDNGFITSVSEFSNTPSNGGFDVVEYAGNGSAQTISNLKFQPDFVWIKNRNGGHNHMLFDVARGAGADLMSNSTTAEKSGGGGLTSFNLNGFSLGSNNAVNESTRTYVAWCWKAGGATVSNTDGTITSQVSANNDYGFSVTTWTGNGSDNKSVGHGLTTAPSLVVIKCTSSSTSWHTYVRSLDPTGQIQLNLNSDSGQIDFGSPFFDADNSKINLYGGSSVGINGGGNTYVSYSWSEVAGFSKVGSYIGSGFSGNTVTTEFEPRYLIIKRINTTGDWWIWDTERGDSKFLYANTSAGGNANDAPIGSYPISATSTGFRIDNGDDLNINGHTYIYMAFADTPPIEFIDLLTDSPEKVVGTDTGAGGEIVGSYPTLNPYKTMSANTLSNGNLTVSYYGEVAGKSSLATINYPTTGKWFYEVHTGGNGNLGVGIAVQNSTFGDNYPEVYALLGDDNIIYYQNPGESTSSTPHSSNWVAGDNIIGCAFDADADTMTIYVNGVATPSWSLPAGQVWAPMLSTWNVDATINFGDQPFKYEAPNGYQTLNTTNLPTPLVEDSSTGFDVIAYEGNNSTLSIDSLEFQPDFVWVKSRFTDSSHQLFDSVRGTTKKLSSNTADAEGTLTNSLTSFDENGFTMGNYSSINNGGVKYIAWCWKANGSTTSTNVNGSIISSVSADPTLGFSIVSYTGTGSNSTVGHGLGAKPEFIITKNRSASSDWAVFHSYAQATGATLGKLNVTAGSFSASDAWQNVAPTSTSIAVGPSTLTNGSGSQMISYCWSEIPGFSHFGKWIGNADVDGPFIYTGFAPRFILWKRVGTSNNWILVDNERSPENPVNGVLSTNTSSAEEGSSTFKIVNFLSNGFKIINSGTEHNANGGTYVYAAFAERPIGF